jgi:AmmeMemoRadiSam system protein B
MRVREPAVAGIFYEAEPVALADTVTRLLGAAAPHPRPKALVAPHAGYLYSGPIAASAFKALETAGEIRRVVLLGPSHYVRVRGLALPAADALRTPLGLVPIDATAVARVREMPQVVEDEAAHAREHSMEVELPFLQRVLGEFSVVPFSVGASSPEEVADVLEALWGGPETLILISSDLSHYLSYPQACAVDRETAARIVALGPALEPERACGATPVNGLLVAARRRGLRAEQWDLRNSADTHGARDGVVGYGAFAFYEARS